jgi:hypothetical protein
MIRRLVHNPRFLTGLTLAVLGLVLWAGVVLALHQDPREIHALKTKGAIVGVTRDDEPLVVGANWQKLLLRTFPQSQKYVGGALVRPVNSPPKSVTVWKNLGSQIQWAGSKTPLFLKLFDERGQSLRVKTHESEAAMIEGAMLTAFPVYAFPYRVGPIRMRFIEPTFSKTYSPDIFITNPEPHPEPNWVRVANAEGSQQRLNVELIQLDRGTVVLGDISRPYNVSANRSSSMRGGYLDLRVLEGGQPTPLSWGMEKADLIDSAGKHCERWVNRIREVDGKMRVEFQDGTLGPNRIYHRIQFELARQANFPAGEVWTIPGVQVPAAGRVVRVGRRRKLSGHTVELTRLVGKGEKPPRIGIMTDPPQRYGCSRPQTAIACVPG